LQQKAAYTGTDSSNKLLFIGFHPKEDGLTCGLLPATSDGNARREPVELSCIDN